jgi:alpha/beta hydrolase family protein
VSRRLCRMFLAASAAALVPIAAAQAATPVPNVTGPLRVTAGSYPFGAADHQRLPQGLRRVGYVEQEYVVRGRANVYDWPGAGGAVVRTAGAPYATRVLVRRPGRARRGSGTVWVEMLNPSNLFDLSIGWALAHRQFVRNGDAWVGITAKPVAMQALKTFDPRRYAPLSFANPLPVSDPRNCSVTGDSTQATENGLIWDVNSQVAAWIRSRASSNPFRFARRALRVYGFGYSQTGGYLARASALCTVA